MSGVGDALREYALAALGALSVLAASYLAIRAGRRDRREDKQEDRDQKIDRLGNRTTHIEGYLEGQDRDFRAYRE